MTLSEVKRAFAESTGAIGIARSIWPASQLLIPNDGYEKKSAEIYTSTLAGLTTYFKQDSIQFSKHLDLFKADEKSGIGTLEVGYTYTMGDLWSDDWKLVEDFLPKDALVKETLNPKKDGKNS